MRSTVLVLAALALASTAVAQQRGGFAGPFTGYEAEALSQLWPEIREADEFSDINWRAYGLSRAPGDAEAQRVLALNWDEIREETRFENIDWDDYGVGFRDNRGRAERFGRSDRDSVFDDDFAAGDNGPFSPEEAATLSRVWPEVRQAAEFDDVDWRNHGLRRAPGDAEAQRVLARNWDELRRASRFEDIDWDRYDAGFDRRRGERFGRFQADDRSQRGFSTDDNGPFTYEEAVALSRVWPQVRQAAEFDDVDWRSVGLSGPPGDREARRVLARHWSQLRAAESFGDIDWEATTGYRTR